MRAECRREKALGEPYDGKRHVRFDEGVLETEATARSSGILARKGRNGLGSQGLTRPPRQCSTLQKSRCRSRPKSGGNQERNQLVDDRANQVHELRMNGHDSIENARIRRGRSRSI